MLAKLIYFWLGQLQEYSAINLCKAYYNRAGAKKCVALVTCIPSLQKILHLNPKRPRDNVHGHYTGPAGRNM